MKRRTFIRNAAIGAAGIVIYPWEAQADTMRSFTDTSWWNTTVEGIPVDPASTDMLTLQAQVETNPYIAIGIGAWSMPFSEAAKKSPVLTLIDQHGTSVSLRANKAHLDEVGEMVGNDKAFVFRSFLDDLEVSSFETIPNRNANGLFSFKKPWMCKAFGVYAPSTNGIAQSLPGGEPPNTGHRGTPPSTMNLLLTELEQGLIDHRLKIALSPPGVPADGLPIWPMTGYEQPRSGGVPEGAVLRLKQEAYDRVNPTGNAATLATAAKDYGFIIGDTGGVATLKAERATTYPPNLNKALSAFTWADYEVLELGFGKPLP